MSLNGVNRNVLHSCSEHEATVSPKLHRFDRLERERSEKRWGVGREGLTSRMTTVETPIAARKIRCSWPQQPSNPQFTLILGHFSPPP
jgi:hypothetical protein